MSGGRPTLYDEGYCEQLESHMREGLSFESFGGVVGVCKDTLYEWAKVHSEFSDAKKRGESGSRLYWEKLGRDGLHNETIKDGDGMTVTRSINATIWIFNMKNRFKWRDKTPEEISEESEANSLHDLSNAELIERLRANRARRAGS